MKKTLIVMCYGPWGNKYRLPAEMVGLREYWNHVIDYCASLQKKDMLSGIIVSGGFTSDKFPDISEAATSAAYLRIAFEIRCLPVEKMNIHLEERSKNTAQNIFFAGKQVLQADEFSRDVIIICDRYRHFKVEVLSHLISPMFEHQLIMNVKSFSRRDVHPNSTYPRQWISALSYFFDPGKVNDDLHYKQPLQ